jgi:lysyl-tRNA synthetase class II
MSTNENNGCELFDAYFAAKKALSNRIKQVLEIMAKFNALDVTPSEVADVVAHEITQVSSHQWRYNAGHETIYCDHYFDFRSHRNFNKCTVKVPVKYLNMTDKEISKENREAALAALEAKKAEIEAQIAEKTKSMRSYLKKINSEIDALKKGDE